MMAQLDQVQETGNLILVAIPTAMEAAVAAALTPILGGTKTVGTSTTAAAVVVGEPAATKKVATLLQ